MVSSLSNHHLNSENKRKLYRNVFTFLRPGGVFVNAEQVKGETPAIDARYREIWERNVRQTGIAEADVQAAFERMKEDRPDTVGNQMEWLEETGFQEVNCWYKNGMFCVFAGTKKHSDYSL